MTETPQVSTSKILSFIEGQDVDLYGNVDAAKEVMPNLEVFMRDGVDAANKSRTHSRNKKLGDFLVSAYRLLANVKPVLEEISATFGTAWESHYDHWFQKCATPLATNPDGLGSTANIKFPCPEDAQDVANTALDEISHTLLKLYLTSLKDLAAKETNNASSEPSGLPQREHQNLCIIDDIEWDKAWVTEFRGDVLKRLEYKLHLNSRAVVTISDKLRMSRIIPLVQASGTGKSRLAEE
jgi:hypothetical protein